MADSDNTTTLPFVTRRELLVGTAITAVVPKRNGSRRSRLETEPSTDPAVAGWRRWQDAQNLTEELCRQQQHLERKLIKAIGFPAKPVRPRSNDRVASNPPAAFEVPDLTLEIMTLQAKTNVESAARNTRWDAADKHIGYSATLKAEREAGGRAQALLNTLSETPATSLAGVLAKLDAVLSDAEASEDSGDLPWSLIRSAFEDVARISRETE